MSQISEELTQSIRTDDLQTTLPSYNRPQDDRVMSVSYVPCMEKHVYNRATHESYNKVCWQLANKYNVDKKGVVLTSSGMAAINLALTSIFIKNNWEHVNVVYSNELYCDTPRLLEHMDKIYSSVDTILIDITDNSYLKSKFEELRGQTNILFIETCTNPTGKIMDFSIIPRLAELSKELFFIVDNTWVTSTLFNPLDYGADLVVTSLTKYYSGGHCISGAVIGKEHLMKDIFRHSKITGNHISLPYCEIILRQMPQMEERIRKTSQITLNIAKFLENHPKVLSVTHPLLDSHPSCHLAKMYFNNLGPSVLTFYLEFNTKADCMKWLDSSDLIQLQTSFGGKETKFDQWPSRFGKDFKIFQIRLAIGYESKETEIIEELKKLLEKLHRVILCN